ncbi:3922_t:CDS:2, partial [Racocetra fulgida]
HYFKVILMTDNAKFYIQFIPSHWYNDSIDVSKEPFLNADKFYEEKSIEETVSPTPYLIYKKALNKALKSQMKSGQLIDLLQEFAEKLMNSSQDSSEDEVNSDKENQEFVLLNPKKRCRK